MAKPPNADLVPHSARSKALDVLVISQFFSPEMGAPAARFHDFGRLLVERGHRVTVLTGFPNSPTGLVPAAYRGRLAQRETIDGIEVLRSWLFASPRLSDTTKSLGFMTFVVSAALQVLLRRIRTDVVIATSPPPTVGIPGVLAAWKLNAPLIVDLRDIWPEAIASSGRLHNGSLIGLLRWSERLLYNRSAHVTVVTEGKRERLIEKGVPAEKIDVIPNGVDLGHFERAKAMRPEDLRDLGLDPDRFLLVYAGIMNPPQGLDVLVDTALRLRATTPDHARRIQLALIGGGSEQARLVARVQEAGLGDMIRFVPVQPRAQIASLLKASGAVVVPLRPRRDSHTVPSKLYEAMASARPVLVSADGPPRSILEEAGAGLATPAGDAEALAGSIRTLLDRPDLVRAFGAQGAAYAQRFDRRVLVERFEALLRSVAARGGR